MNEHVFVSERPSLLANWSGAFGASARLAPAPDAAAGSVLIWLDSTTLEADALEGALDALRESGGSAVVMSATPDAAQGASYMNRGAVGYCHLYAVAEQLRAIALVIENGGVWLPPALMQRILALSVGAAKPATASPDALDKLSERERAVATEVARGASNREIAERLDISERTVKAHLSSTFDKLNVRDRVQLALLVHNVDVA